MSPPAQHLRRRDNAPVVFRPGVARDRPLGIEFTIATEWKIGIHPTKGPDSLVDKGFPECGVAQSRVDRHSARKPVDREVDASACVEIVGTDKYRLRDQ